MTEVQPFTLSANVAASATGAPVASGTITFTETQTGTNLGNATVDSSGAASLLVSSLPNLGDNEVTATYSGNTNFGGSSSATLPVAANLGSITVSTGGDAYSTDGSYVMSKTVGVADPNPGASSWSVSVDYGDGYSDSWSASSAGALDLQHQCASAGAFTVSVSITDDLGALGQATFNAYLS